MKNPGIFVEVWKLVRDEEVELNIDIANGRMTPPEFSEQLGSFIADLQAAKDRLDLDIADAEMRGESWIGYAD